MLVDTDILIWAIRGKEQATQFLDSLSEIHISDITYMELIQGTRDKRELQALRLALEDMGVIRVPVTSHISGKAAELVEKFCHSHAMYLADALIGATAITHELPLSTGNVKHFSPIPGLELHKFSP